MRWYIGTVWHRAPVEKAMDAPLWREVMKRRAESPEHFKQIITKELEGAEIEFGVISEPWSAPLFRGEQ